MGALIPLLLPLLPSVINLVESLFSGKPKSGTDKMDALVSGLRAIIAKMITSGTLVNGLPVVQPTDDALIGLVEAKLLDMKLTGTLGNTDTGQIWLLRGGTITLLTAAK